MSDTKTTTGQTTKDSKTTSSGSTPTPQGEPIVKPAAAAQPLGEPIVKP